MSVNHAFPSTVLVDTAPFMRLNKAFMQIVRRRQVNIARRYRTLIIRDTGDPQLRGPCPQHDDRYCQSRLFPRNSQA